MSNKKWACARLAANNFPINKAAVSRAQERAAFAAKGGPRLPG